MATQRACNLIHANPVLWLGEINRQDSRIASRLQLMHEVKERQRRPRHTHRARYLIAPAKCRNDSALPAACFWSSQPRVFPSPFATSALAIFSPSQKSSAASLKAAISSPPTDPERPSADQLQKVYDSIQIYLPKLFSHMMDYRIYSQDVELINNVHKKTTRGLMKYVQQVALLRLVGHVKFAYVKVELVSMSQHPEEGRITVKWRIVGLSGLRVMLQFWKFKLWEWQQIMQQTGVWHDFISHVDVGPDGLVYRHILDQVEQDKEQVEDGKRSKSPLVAKLALIAALFPRDEWGEAIACQGFLQSSTNTNADGTGQKC